MIAYLRYRAKLTKLFRQKESVRSAYTDEIRQARMNCKSADDIRSLEDSSYFEDRTIDEEISILVTDSLIRKAHRRFVPIPSREAEGMWEQCDKTTNRYVLTSNGISELRSALRAERRQHVEHTMMVLATLTGIVGAVTGLIAVILK